MTTPSNKTPDEPPEWWRRLTPEQQAFIRQLTGSDWRPNPTLEEVGRLFDETRRRIREIEERALKKLRNGDGDEPAHS